MSTEVIKLKVDSEAAEVFRSASTKEQEKLQELFGIWLKEYARTDSSSLKETMNDISQKAQSKGLTAEILDSILGKE